LTAFWNARGGRLSIAAGREGVTGNEILGRELRAEFGESLVGLMVVALSDGGAEVARAMVTEHEEEPEPYLLDGFAAVARLARSPSLEILLVDDGTSSAEEIAAAAWSLKSLEPVRLIVAAPEVSRYLSLIVPPSCEVNALRRYVPTRATRGAERRHPRPDRAGNPWTPEEEGRLESMVRDRTPLKEIATALQRSRSAISARIAQMAVRPAP
jgi:hypothetical protein